MVFCPQLSIKAHPSDRITKHYRYILHLHYKFMVSPTLNQRRIFFYFLLFFFNSLHYTNEINSSNLQRRMTPVGSLNFQKKKSWHQRLIHWLKVKASSLKHWMHIYLYHYHQCLTQLSLYLFSLGLYEDVRRHHVLRCFRGDVRCLRERELHGW